MGLIGVSNKVVTWQGEGGRVWRSKPPTCWASPCGGPASLNFPSLVVGLEVHSPHPTLFL